MSFKRPTLDRLKSMTSDRSVTEELLAYCDNRFVKGLTSASHLEAMEDEAHINEWMKYVHDAEGKGVYTTLKKHLVQFRFPIKKGISRTSYYRNATLKGTDTRWIPEATGLELRDPGRLQLSLYKSLAGRIPVLVVGSKPDFKTIIQALSYRNEPKELPDSMGAAIVRGLNNWNRVAQLSSPSLLDQKSLYQDTLIVLSRSAYSGVPAEAVRQKVEEWEENSLRIRLEHECTHYFTLRCLGVMSNHLHDEIIADYMGIAAVHPNSYKQWQLLFFGLENHPSIRRSGRMSNYLSKPKISDRATEMLIQIVVQAIEHIAEFDREIGIARTPNEKKAKILALCRMNLLELAAADSPDLLYHYFKKLRTDVEEGALRN